MDGQRKLKAAQRAVHRRRRARLARGAVPGGGRRRHASASSTSTSSTSATCSGRSSTARPTSGRPKLESAQRSAARRINPDVQVETHETALTSENALDIFKDYDVIVDGTDNFPTRYLVNDACVLLGKPNVYGSIFRFEGQASVFADQGRAVLSLPVSRAAAAGLVPSCAEGGVLGVLPGVIGTIQATEAIKLILGIGEPLDRPAAALRRAAACGSASSSCGRIPSARSAATIRPSRS